MKNTHRVIAIGLLLLAYIVAANADRKGPPPSVNGQYLIPDANVSLSVNRDSYTLATFDGQWTEYHVRSPFLGLPIVTNTMGVQLTIEMQRPANSLGSWQYDPGSVGAWKISEGDKIVLYLKEVGLSYVWSVPANQWLSAKME
jgi:hypothetical protein